VTDLTGGVVNSYAYDAYGNAEAAVESLPQRFRYTGREWDGVTRLYHYRARAYDPETGRFLQEDPLWFNAGDLNVHRYVGNNPVNAVDPSGMLADDKAIEDAIAVRTLLAGQIARRQMLSTGARTAQYLASEDKNRLSSIAADISCTFYILADAIEQAGPNTEIVGVDRSKCGVVAMSVPDRGIIIEHREPPEICEENFRQCQMTVMGGSKKFPGKFGKTRCHVCYQQCIARDGIWPHYLQDGKSCRFWQYRTID
jgi:RHS repeat-associated protein